MASLHSYWTVKARDIAATIRDGEERRFVQLLNALLRAEADRAHRPSSVVREVERTKAKDGGVDAVVLEALPGVEGWLAEKTVWQFKAFEVQPQDLVKELRRTPATQSAERQSRAASERWVRQRLKDGFAYRAAVLNDLTDQQIEDWERQIDTAVRKIRREAPLARVLGITKIARWVSRFPAVVLEYFRPNAPGSVRTYTQWRRELRHHAKNFYASTEAQQAIARIQSHLGESAEARPVLRVQGLPGVGKSRLVMEALHAVGRRVLYTSNPDHAVQLAHEFARDEHLGGVIVADECSAGTRDTLGSILAAHHGRVRVIAIDNASEPAAWRHEPDVLVGKASDDDLRRIAEQNFALRPEQLERYVQLTRGYVRLLIDVCENAPRIERSGGASLPDLGDYLRRRLTERQLDLMSALSLGLLVGAFEARKSELPALASSVHLYTLSASLQAECDELNQRTGLVGRAGDFFYVTPEIVAQQMFEVAWRRWIKSDVAGFMARLPLEFEPTFRARVERTANAEVRDVLARYFCHWAAALTEADLSSASVVRRLTFLIESDYPTYLPLARRLLEQPTRLDLAAVGGDWRTRASLINALRWASQKEETFVDAERALRALARADSARSQWNGPFKSWSALFDVSMSGTPVPFSDRAEVLEQLLDAPDEDVAVMAVEALGDAVRGRETREVPGAPAHDRAERTWWSPATHEEHARANRDLVALARRACASESPRVAAGARTALIKNVRSVLLRGGLETLRACLTNPSLDELGLLLRGIDEFRRFDASRRRASSDEDAYPAAVDAWRASLTEHDWRHRLRAAVERDGWRAGTESDRPDAAMEQAADELIASPERWPELVLTTAAGTNGVFLLGRTLVVRDASFDLLESVLRASAAQGATMLARGMLVGWLERHPADADRLNGLVDDIERTNPTIAIDLSLMSPAVLHAEARASRCVIARRLPVAFAQVLDGAVLRGEIDGAAFLRLATAVHETGRGTAEGNRALLRLLSYRAWRIGLRENGDLATVCPPTPPELDLIRDTVVQPPEDSYDWWQVMRWWSTVDRPGAIQRAAEALGYSDDDSRAYSIADEAIKVLCELAARSADDVVSAVGAVALDPRRGLAFLVRNYRALLAGIRGEAWESWLGQRGVGVRGARVIARHLPVPRVVGGEMHVHPLTAYVLRTYEDDRRTFDEFCAGASTDTRASRDLAGDLAREAEDLRAFSRHPLRRVREWAAQESQSLLAAARHWREQEELRQRSA